MNNLVGTYLVTAFTAGAGFAGIYLPLSLLVRWWLGQTSPHAAETTSPEPADAGPELPPEQARQLVAKLHEVATRLTREIGEHSASMEEINTELEGIDAQDSEKAIEVVLTAVDRIATANRQLTTRLNSAQRTIGQQGQLLESHMADALTDSLTKIANRRAFDHELQRRYAEWHRKQTPLSLLMMDVDHFKRFNDEHGHLAGDEVLKRVARILSESMREMDLVARYGGEEFAVILPDTELESGKVAAERVRTALERNELEFEGKVLRVTSSVGLAQARSGDGTEGIIRRADEALYASKEAGRNCSHYQDGQTCVLISKRSDGRTADKDPPTSQEPKQADEAVKDAHKATTKATGKEVQVPLTDDLTGLPTCAALRHSLQQRIAEWQRMKVPLSLIVVKLDEFERVRDIGEKASDFAVDAVARLLRAGSRKMDLVARCKEDEFAVLLPSCDLTEAVTPAERIRKAVAACDKLKYQGTTVRFTVSVGIAEATDEDDETTLFARAETAARQASSRSSNYTYFHNGTTCESVASMATA
ncbi:MAG: GGDEF domain-containing protein [Pirellulales bacterium]